MTNFICILVLDMYLLICWVLSYYYSDKRNLDCKMRTDYACIMFCLCVLTPLVVIQIGLIPGFFCCCNGKSMLARRREYAKIAETGYSCSVILFLYLGSAIFFCWSQVLWIDFNEEACFSTTIDKLNFASWIIACVYTLFWMLFGAVDLCV